MAREPIKRARANRGSLSERLKNNFRILRHDLSGLAYFLVAVLVVRLFIVSPGVVSGRSMQPTMQDGDRFLVNRVGAFVSTPERYDIVQVIDPMEDRRIVKRVVALPGESVVRQNDRIFVRTNDGLDLEVTNQTDETDTEVSRFSPIEGADIYRVPDYSYYLLGDNRDNSEDSRTRGAFHRSYIVGEVWRWDSEN